MNALDIPRTAAGACFLILMPGHFWGSTFKGLTVELFGTQVESVDGLRACYALELPKLLDGKILLWRRRVFRHADELSQREFKLVLSPLKPSTSYVEAVWRPKQEERFFELYTLAEQDLVDRGRRLLRKVARDFQGGRRAGWTKRKIEEFEGSLEFEN
jgi:hypothetical protein